MGHFKQAGYRPELAWACCDYADTLLKRNEPGDREKAMSLLDESLAISSELGIPFFQTYNNNKNYIA